jgi:predicted RNase H-like HicB family nuclease
MSGSRKKHVRKKGGAIDRPFDPAILRRAREIANQYKIILEPDPEEIFIGRALEMPLCIGTGKTADACVRDTRELAVSALATMLEMGEVPPAPAMQGLRREQNNNRVTPEERLALEEAARRRGFRGISDFVRSTTLSNVK